jgi:hypothetical protein
MPGPSRSGGCAHIAPISGTMSGLPTGPRMTRSDHSAAILRCSELVNVATCGWIHRQMISGKSSTPMPLEMRTEKPAVIRYSDSQRTPQCRSGTGNPLAHGITLSRRRTLGTSVCWQPSFRVRVPRCAGSVCCFRRRPSSASSRTCARCGMRSSIR